MRIKHRIRCWKRLAHDNLRTALFVARERLTGYQNMKRVFFERTGYELDLKNPISFNQKICWKKIYDRNPLLPIIADKYRVREYLKDALGKEDAEKILIPLLYVTGDPRTIPFDRLPDEYIIKANHGSGEEFRLVVTDGKKVDRKYVIGRCSSMLTRPYGALWHEWAYQKIKRKIVVETLLRDKNGDIPHDYKFFIFHGKCQMIEVIDETHALDRNWNSLDAGWKDNVGGKERYTKKPENLEEMVNLAELLGSPFDFIRVDLYSVDGRIFFGELTNYPASGIDQFNPTSFDFELGFKWTLTPKYWKNQ